MLKFDIANFETFFYRAHSEDFYGECQAFALVSVFRCRISFILNLKHDKFSITKHTFNSGSCFNCTECNRDISQNPTKPNGYLIMNEILKT